MDCRRRLGFLIFSLVTGFIVDVTPIRPRHIGPDHGLSRPSRGQRVDVDLPGGEAQLAPKKRGRPVGSKNKPKISQASAAKTVLKKAAAVVKRKQKLAKIDRREPVIGSRRSQRQRSAVQTECKRLMLITSAVECEARDKPRRRLTRRERRAAKRTFKLDLISSSQRELRGQESAAALERARVVLTGAAGFVGRLVSGVFQ